MEEVGTIDILVNMFFMYNTIMHSSIVPLNFGIILKEIEMQFFEVAQHIGGKESDYNLTFANAKKSFYDDLWFLDPLRVF
jgi:hypothetical protein